MADSESQPAMSVVIASWSGEAALTRCLESVLPQLGSGEAIVAFRGVPEFPAHLSEKYPGVRFVRGAADATVFQLRSLGVHTSRGNIVALLEDHAEVGSGWAGAFQAAHAAGRTVFGGPIDNDKQSSAYDWALYFVEYGIYMSPIAEGKAAILSGVNIGYDRAALWSCRNIWQSDFYETDVNAALVAAGHELTMLPRAAVKCRLRMPLREALSHLFTGGQHFGKFRSTQSSSRARRLWTIASPAVPVVLLSRIVRLTLSRQPARMPNLMRGLPFLLMLLGAWSAGEAASYARGSQPRQDRASAPPS